MACKCSAMANCKADIQRVRDIEEYLQSAKDMNGAIDSTLGTFSSQLLSMLESANISELSVEVKKLNDAFTDILPQLLASCGTQISALESAYSSMASEDWDHHHPPEED